MERIPWFVPGVALALLVALVAAAPLARRMACGRPVAGLLVLASGSIVAATLTPLQVAAGEPTGWPCDLSRIGLIPLELLGGINDATLNVALFVPLGLALGLLPSSRARAVLIGLAIAAPPTIEALQLVVPVLARGCQSADVADNLTGLAVGLGAGLVIARAWARAGVRRRGRGPANEA